MDINTDIDILLAKYFSGEASTNDLSKLDSWLAESEENQAYFDQLTTIYEESAPILDVPKVDTAKALSMFEQHMQQSSQDENVGKKKRSAKLVRIYLSVAATVAILLAASFFFLLRTANDQSIQIASNDNTVEYTLPDSTVVHLAHNSSISYSKDYINANKTVTLSGKASFDVGEEGEGKLVVCVGETFIEDIGTVFTVDGYFENQYISVSVESGIVLFYTEENNGLNLYEGETGYFDKTSKQFSKQVGGRAVEYSQIVFNATPLAKVIERLNQQLDANITLTDSNISNRPITVSFSSNDNVEHILQIIAETLELNLQYQHGTYILSSH